MTLDDLATLLIAKITSVETDLKAGIARVEEKVDTLIQDARLMRHEERRHGIAIADHEERISDIEETRPSHPGNGAAE
jgi:hypothetical protein